MSVRVQRGLRLVPLHDQVQPWSVPSADRIAGDLLQYDRPNWGPLEHLVGRQLAPSFMWMHSVQLDDDAVVHAYKHLSTRRYCHLAEDGRAFLHTPAGGYREVTRRLAIVVAFDGWASLCPQPERAAVRAALRRATTGAREH
jgi:hypothetical protein